MEHNTIVSGSILIGLILYIVYKRLTRLSLNDIPGPAPESVWLGSMGQLGRSLVGKVDAAWLEKYGGVVHLKGPFGQDLLWVADGRALSFIFNQGYNFPKTNERVAFDTLATDYGLVTTDGDVHKRQRKVMQPAFGAPESKALFPIFSRCAESISAKWRDQLLDSSGQVSVFNMPTWISNAALDAIGEAAFDYNFGAINNEGNDFSRSYQSLMVHAYSSPPDLKIILDSLARFIPYTVLVFIYDHLPALRMLHENREEAHKFARQVLADKDAALAKGHHSRDILSILVRANNSEDASRRMTETEMIAQMRAILLAGHETTSTSLGWGLLELARRPEIQSRLRKEIHDIEAIVKLKGRGINASDVENMPYLQAIVKEILRLNPPAYHMQRCSKEDVAIPMSRPIITKSGKEIREVLVPKGTRIMLSIVGYNRDKTVWGADALEFNPDRWLDEKRQSSVQVGVYANLATFSGGVRSCIGWRFAIHEIQAFLIELVGNFEFTPTEACRNIRKEPCLIMAPIIEGEKPKGAQIPLKVTLARRET
ncbi:hypothetical protein EUX98_g2557 [Antrodiella citrinella]|uniref:Cytochrome P450 n=1 Tax=Antrodiella citrinella TaxID=2447956 RepID=A0A4S4MYS1_9APHY|nr:hypothetical protein EUX98_g2557 [Antrodiella citrinella]